MASSSKSKLSNSTLSLRFMQRSSQNAISPQQAKLVDDSEWQVGQDVLNMWARQKFQGDNEDEAVHDSSYLPFVFSDSQGSTSNFNQAGPSNQSSYTSGKRVFGRVPDITPKRDDVGADEHQARDDQEDGGEDDSEDQPKLHTAHTSKPKSNTPTRRPGALLSKGARLVQMARESKSKSKSKPPPENDSDSNLTKNPSRQPVTSSKHHVPTRRLLKPDVHLPLKAELDNESGPVIKALRSGEIGDDLREGSGNEEKKYKRKRELKKIDLVSDVRHQKKLKEIQ